VHFFEKYRRFPPFLGKGVGTFLLLYGTVLMENCSLTPKLTGIEPFTVSLVACIRAGLRSFLQGASLAANSHFPAQINRRQKLSDLQI